MGRLWDKQWQQPRTARAAIARHRVRHSLYHECVAVGLAHAGFPVLVAEAVDVGGPRATWKHVMFQSLSIKAWIVSSFVDHFCTAPAVSGVLARHSVAAPGTRSAPLEQLTAVPSMWSACWKEQL